MALFVIPQCPLSNENRASQDHSSSLMSLTFAQTQRTRLGMRYTKYGILFGLVIVTVGVALTLKYGYRPAPTRIMKPSFFDHPQEVGTVVLKRFYASLVDEPVVVFGIPTNRDWAGGVLDGFVTAANANNRSFARAIVEKNLNEKVRSTIRASIANTVEIDTNSESLHELTDAIQAARAVGEKVLVVVPNLYSTHLLDGNPMQRLEAGLAKTSGVDPEHRRPLFALSVGPLALEPAQEKDLDPLCIGAERDGSGTADFGCAIMQASRGYYRELRKEKNVANRSRFTAVMQEPKPNDYLLLVREPQ